MPGLKPLFWAPLLPYRGRSLAPPPFVQRRYRCEDDCSPGPLSVESYFGAQVSISVVDLLATQERARIEYDSRVAEDFLPRQRLIGGIRARYNYDNVDSFFWFALPYPETDLTIWTRTIPQDFFQP